MRAVLAVLLAGACARDAPPPLSIPAGREPEVAVWLRSLGEPRAVVVRSPRGVRAGGTTRDAVRVVFGESRDVVRLEPVDGLLVVEVDGKRYAYAGKLDCLPGESGLRLVNRLGMENYVLGVLRGELPLPQVSREAAAAQAVAARSYALHYLAQGREGHDLDDTTLYQRYVGYAPAPDDDALRAGVRATAGRYLEWRGEPLKAYYHSTCGGHTTDLETGLQRENTPVYAGAPCTACEGTRYWRWEAAVPAKDLLAAAGLRGELRGVAVTSRGPGGRAREVRVDASEGSRTLPAAELRLRVGPSRLRSTLWLEVRPSAGGVAFAGAGWGHGVGLCQMGALGRARAGTRCQDILAAYYPGAKLASAY